MWLPMCPRPSGPLMGLMLQRPSWWPLFGLTMFGLLLWSTIFGYVVAAGSHRRPEA